MASIQAVDSETPRNGKAYPLGDASPGAKTHYRITTSFGRHGGILARHWAAAVQRDASRVVSGRSPASARVRWVFPYRGGAIKQPTQVAWLNACKAARLADFHWHDLRHTWASWHVQNGTPLAVLQELGGWRDLKMVLRYAHLAPGHLAPFAGNSGLAKPQDVEIDRAQNRSHGVLVVDDEEEEILLQINGVADGTRTHDNRNHNPGLYQLSYSHHWSRQAGTSLADSRHFSRVWAAFADMPAITLPFPADATEDKSVLSADDGDRSAHGFVSRSAKDVAQERKRA